MMIILMMILKKIVDYACDLLSKIGDYVGKELSSK